MFFVSRRFVCERLGISPWASYGFFSATESGLIPSDRVIALLNRSRKARELELDFIPSDVVTAEELSERTGIPAKKLLAWTRRKKNVPPHFRMNKQTTRFRVSSFDEWTERRFRGRRG